MLHPRSQSVEEREKLLPASELHKRVSDSPLLLNLSPTQWVGDNQIVKLTLGKHIRVRIKNLNKKINEPDMVAVTPLLPSIPLRPLRSTQLNCK